MRGDSQAERMTSGPPDEPASGPGIAVTQKRGSESGTFRNLAIGASIGWVTLPILVITDGAARYVGGGDSIVVPVAWAGIAGAVVGALTRAAGLGRVGLVAVVAGALSGALLPYLVIAPVLGLGTIEVGAIDHYSILFGRYLPVAVAAVSGSILGSVIAARSSVRMPLRPAPSLVVGLVFLALWFTAWAFWALALSPRAV
jgi:hypothetical protein